MEQDDLILCEKGEWLRRRLCAVNDGKLVHEAGRIANLLCNYVPCLKDICIKIEQNSSNWSKEDAVRFYNKVKTALKKGIAEAIKFCKINDID